MDRKKLEEEYMREFLKEREEKKAKELKEKKEKKVKEITEGVTGCLGLIVAVFVIVFIVRSCSGLDSETSDSEASDLLLETSAEERAREEAEKRRKGFHCLSSWNGAHRGVVRLVKDNLHDAKSFEHISTRVSPVGSDGMHSLRMTYRAKNLFGAYVRSDVVAEYANSDCSAMLISFE